MEHKYITTQLEHYSGYGVEITRSGLYTNDPELIEKLENSPDFGRWYFRVPTEDEMRETATAWAKEMLRANDAPSEYSAVEIEAVEAGNIDDELEALADEVRIREEQAQAEEDAALARQEHNLGYTERFKPNAAKARRASLEAKKDETAKKRGRPKKNE